MCFIALSSVVKEEFLVEQVFLCIVLAQYTGKTIACKANFSPRCARPAYRNKNFLFPLCFQAEALRMLSLVSYLALLSAGRGQDFQIEAGIS